MGMKLIISTHNIKLSDAIEKHILDRIDKLEHFDRWTVDARVILEHDHTRVPEKQFSCSVRMSVRGPDLFAEAADSDLYVAIDKVTTKIELQLRKRHEKRVGRKQKEGAKSKVSRQRAGA
jgi:putative sigma-54 modulation protein